jgi:hypothetical protein
LHTALTQPPAARPPILCGAWPAGNYNLAMRTARLILCLAALVPGCAFLGACAAIGTYFPAWGGALIGGSLGLFFGLAFGGALPRSVADYLFGPEETDAPP